TLSWKNEDLHKKFTQLLLLQRPHPRSLKSLVRRKRQVPIMENQGHLIEIRDLFGPGLGAQEEPRIVILHGAAGIGKSTLAREVQRGWEEGQLYQDRFQHVFYFSCAELAQSKVMSLADLITQAQEAPPASLQQVLSRPEQLLFILDGVDEPRWVLQQQNAEFCQHWSQPQQVAMLLGSLLGKTILPEASFLITTRTVALQQLIPSLKQPRWVEVLGFSESSRKEYFYSYFTVKSQALRALSLVESNPAVWTMCLMPWLSWLVCTCLKQQMERGEDLTLTTMTVTGLYWCYLSQALPAQPLRPHLRSICSLAAEGIRRKRSLFSPGDLRRHGLNGRIISTFVTMGVLLKHPNSRVYSFIHRCFQEFLAAVSYVLGDEKRGEHCNSIRGVRGLPQAHKTHVLSRAPTRRFLFGLLGEQAGREMESIFTCQRAPELKQELLQWAKREACVLQSPQLPGFLELFYCLYETQDEEFVTQVMVHFQGSSVCVQTGMELLVFTFCIKFCHHMKRLQLNKDLVVGINLSLCSNVYFMQIPVTDACWQPLFSILEVTGSLKELDLSGNSLSHSAVQSLRKTLRRPRCHLETLRLVSCGLTFSCCKDLASVLSTSPSLKELDLRWNNLGDLGVRQLCEGLRHPTCSLTLLWLDQAFLGEKMKEELRTLEKEKPALLISSRWERGPRTPSGWCRLRAEPRDRQISRSKSAKVSGTFHMEPPGTEDEFLGPMGPVAAEVVDIETRSLYRWEKVSFTTYIYRHCDKDGYHFKMERSKTSLFLAGLNSQFCTYTLLINNHSITSVTLPLPYRQGEETTPPVSHHYMMLESSITFQDSAKISMAHTQHHIIFIQTKQLISEHLTINEKTSETKIKVLLTKLDSVRALNPCLSILLLYRRPPNDCSIQKAIDDEEKKFQFVRIHKPNLLTSLYMGSRYSVSGSGKLEMIPNELELCYRSPGEAQMFSEFYVAHMESGFRLQMRDKKHRTVVWKALVKPDKLSPMLPRLSGQTEAPDSSHREEPHKHQLVARVTSVDSVLDKLYGQVLSEEQYKQVRAEVTRPDQMRKLFSFSKSWDQACKDRLYQALKETHPHLIMDLL
uniref:NLR family pyrin domain containing 1 n=1 Tax=Otolemur garnettii TaxID=30611 RepID=H0XJM6_OTOGA